MGTVSVYVTSTTVVYSHVLYSPFLVKNYHQTMHWPWIKVHSTTSPHIYPLLIPSRSHLNLFPPKTFIHKSCTDKSYLMIPFLLLSNFQLVFLFFFLKVSMYHMKNIRINSYAYNTFCRCFGLRAKRILVGEVSKPHSCQILHVKPTFRHERSHFCLDSAHASAHTKGCLDWKTTWSRVKNCSIDY